MMDLSSVKKLNSDNIPRRKRFRTLVLLLSALVVFVTTYMLILPAITLDENEALEQGGIDLAVEETMAEEPAVTDYTAEVGSVLSDDGETPALKEDEGVSE